MLAVEAPNVEKRILPSLSREELEYLIEQAECVRDKAIISLFADSGLRLSELADIDPRNIDWETNTVKVIGKGNREGLAPFGDSTKAFLQQWIAEYRPDGKLWGITSILRRLEQKTGLPCNAHTFKRTFACLLRKAGIDTMTIKDPGR